MTPDLDVPFPPPAAAEAEAAQSASTVASMPWWSSPLGISLGFLLPVIGLTVVAGEAGLSTLTIRGIRFLDLASLGIVAGMIVVAAVGGWLGNHLSLPGPQRSSEVQWDDAATAVGAIALVAYVIWFRDYLFNPPLLFAILTGAFRVERDASLLTPGITSLVNTAPVFFAVYAYRTMLSRGTPVRRRTHVVAFALILFTLFRAHVWSERLAAIEMAVPFGLGGARLLMDRRGAIAQVARVGGPYLALPLLIVFFGAAEYSRSWSLFDTYRGKSEFWTFALGRFISYYYTSLNNGAGMLATVDWPTYSFEFTLGWLHSMPLLIGRGFSEVVGSDGVRFQEFLMRYGDPEFNSPSGMFCALADLGVPLGVLYVFVTGLFSGVMFRAYCERRLVGILLYPMCFIAFLEVLRYLYLGTARGFTTVMGAVLVMILLAVFNGTQRWKTGPA